MIILLLGLMIQFNEKEHPSGKTFCERNLIDYDPHDEQTRQFLEEKKKREENDHLD